MRDRARDWSEQDRRPRREWGRGKKKEKFFICLFYFFVLPPILRTAVPLARSSLSITADEKRWTACSLGIRYNPRRLRAGSPLAVGCCGRAGGWSKEEKGEREIRADNGVLAGSPFPSPPQPPCVHRTQRPTESLLAGTSRFQANSCFSGSSEGGGRGRGRSVVRKPSLPLSLSPLFPPLSFPQPRRWVSGYCTKWRIQGQFWSLVLTLVKRQNVAKKLDS